jgi:hypothetical protein
MSLAENRAPPGRAVQGSAVQAVISETGERWGVEAENSKGTMFVEAWQNWDMLGMMEQLKGLGRSATYIAGQ